MMAGNSLFPWLVLVKILGDKSLFPLLYIVLVKILIEILISLYLVLGIVGIMCVAGWVGEGVSEHLCVHIAYRTVSVSQQVGMK